MRAHTTNLIANNEDYAIYDLDNGGVRFLMFEVCGFDFPAGHAEYDHVKSLTMDAAEEAFDAFYLKYIPLRTDGYAHLNA